MHSLYGAVAQLGEHLACNQEVVGSIPIGSIIFVGVVQSEERFFAKEEVRGCGTPCQASPSSRGSQAHLLARVLSSALPA